MARRASSGSDLIERLNEMVAELIKTNRRLKREVEQLTTRRPAARSAVKRSSRAVPRRAKPAPKKTLAVKRSRKTTPAPKAKRKVVPPRRRKKTR